MGRGSGAVKAAGRAGRRPPMRIVPGDLDDPRVVDLLRVHLTSARAATAPGSAHALDLAGLRSPDISFWAAWDGETLLGFGALKRLSANHGEVKSMHVAEVARRRGSAARCCATSSPRHARRAWDASASRRGPGTIFA